MEVNTEEFQVIEAVGLNSELVSSSGELIQKVLLETEKGLTSKGTECKCMQMHAN